MFMGKVFKSILLSMNPICQFFIHTHTDTYINPQYPVNFFNIGIQQACQKPGI